MILPTGKNVICIPAGKSQLSLIKATRSMGMQVLGIDLEPIKIGGDSGYKTLQVSTHDFEAVTTALIPELNDFQPNTVLCRSSGPPVLTAALLSNWLGLKTASVACAMAAVDKSVLKRFAKTRNISVIPGILINKEFSDYEIHNEKRLVIKPNQPKVGKVDVCIVENRDNYQAAIEKACAASYDGNAILEPYINGEDVTAILVMANSKCVFSTLIEELNETGPNGTTAQGISGPSRYSETSVGNSILCAGENLASEWEYHNGFLFLSFRVDEQHKPWLYEVNTGLCGDEVADRLLPAMWPGFDPLGLEIQIMSGQFDTELNLGPPKQIHLKKQSRRYEE